MGRRKKHSVLNSVAMMVSNCCGAEPWGHIDEVDMLGICSNCREHCELEDDNQYE